MVKGGKKGPTKGLISRGGRPHTYRTTFNIITIVHPRGPQQLVGDNRTENLFFLTAQ